MKLKGAVQRRAMSRVVDVRHVMCDLTRLQLINLLLFKLCDDGIYYSPQSAFQEAREGAS